MIALLKYIKQEAHDLNLTPKDYVLYKMDTDNKLKELLSSDK